MTKLLIATLIVTLGLTACGPKSRETAEARAYLKGVHTKEQAMNKAFPVSSVPRLRQTFEEICIANPGQLGEIERLAFERGYFLFVTRPDGLRAFVSKSGEPSILIGTTPQKEIKGNPICAVLTQWDEEKFVQLQNYVGSYPGAELLVEREFSVFSSLRRGKAYKIQEEPKQQMLVAGEFPMGGLGSTVALAFYTEK